MKSNKISLVIGKEKPFFVISRQYRCGKWIMRHIHYYKHKRSQKLRYWYEEKFIFKILNKLWHCT